MILSSVFLSLMLAFNCIYDLRQEQQNVRVIIESISEYLSEKPGYDAESDHNLFNQLKEIKRYLEELKAHNRELEEIVSLRQQNYLAAVTADLEWPDKVARMMSLLAKAAVEDSEVEKWERILKSNKAEGR